MISSTTDVELPLDHQQGQQRKLLNVPETAQFLGVSESWVRRHKAELPLVPMGRLIRFDAELLEQKFSSRMSNGKPLKPERTNMQLCRYQRGYVYQSGKQKTWYARFRVDVRTPDGKVERLHRNIRLGTVSELPTKNAARIRLSEMMGDCNATADMKFRELTERWRKAEGPTKKASTLSHHENALRAYVTPFFADRVISTITREDIQLYLAQQAHKYSESTLRSMRVVLGLTLGWANKCGWIEKNPCTSVGLPQETAGRTVTRTVLTAEQVNAIAGKLKEPYATLVLFLAASGLRIGEALAIRWTDFKNNVIHITHRIYDGDVDKVKSKRSERKLPIDPALVARMKKLGKEEWVFCSRTGTPLNPGNVLKRHVRPAVKELGITIGGWHDFRHTLSTKLRRSGVHPKVVSDILGHKKVNLAMDVYDRTEVADFVQPLSVVAGELFQSVPKTAASA